jgi:hypothetical protein
MMGEIGMVEICPFAVYSREIGVKGGKLPGKGKGAEEG